MLDGTQPRSEPGRHSQIGVDAVSRLHGGALRSFPPSAPSKIDARTSPWTRRRWSGCGVMTGVGAALNTAQGDARLAGRCVRLWRCRPLDHPGCSHRGRRADHRHRPRGQQARDGQELRRHPHRERQATAWRCSKCKELTGGEGAGLHVRGRRRSLSSWCDAYNAAARQRRHRRRSWAWVSLTESRPPELRCMLSMDGKTLEGQLLRRRQRTPRLSDASRSISERKAQSRRYGDQLHTRSTMDLRPSRTWRRGSTPGA